MCDWVTTQRYSQNRFASVVGIYSQKQQLRNYHWMIQERNFENYKKDQHRILYII